MIPKRKLSDGFIIRVIFHVPYSKIIQKHTIQVNSSGSQLDPLTDSFDCVLCSGRHCGLWTSLYVLHFQGLPESVRMNNGPD